MKKSKRKFNVKILMCSLACVPVAEWSFIWAWRAPAIATVAIAVVSIGATIILLDKLGV